MNIKNKAKKDDDIGPKLGALHWTFLVGMYIFFAYVIFALSLSLLLFYATQVKVIYQNTIVQAAQRYHYQITRRAWQSHSDCVDFDSDLRYIPKINSSCIYNTSEFNSNVTFNENGRLRPISNHSKHNKISSPSKGIAILGDSHAMGFGVNDDQTFAYLLESKINIPVFNLAVSGYETERELIRLDKSNLKNSIDTVIIQYCVNDLAANSYRIRNTDSIKYTYSDFKEITKPYGERGAIRSYLSILRFSLIAPINFIYANYKKDQDTFDFDFSNHVDVFEETLSKFKFLNGKRVIIIYSNDFGQRFINFFGKAKNLQYIDLELNSDAYYSLDDHLSPVGHKMVADRLTEILKKTVIKD